MNHQLEAGAPTTDQLQSENERLQSEVDRLNGVNGRLQSQAEEARKSADKGARAVHALGVLRTQLGPLHKALVAIFSELDTVGVQEQVPSADSGRSSSIAPELQSWRLKFGEGSVKTRFLDALISQRSLTVKQLMVFMKAGHGTVYGAAAELGRLQLVVNSGGRYSLRSSS